MNATGTELLNRQKKSPRFVVAAALLSAALIAAPTALAANQDRIGGNIANGAHVEIADSVHPRVRTATDLGPTAGDMKLGMSLRFSMTDAQSAALDQLLTNQQNPASPQYHQWLTPEQFAAQFGLSQADIASVTAWLTAQGFIVTGVANGRSFVTFEGTVAQAQVAFGTSIHDLSSNGETHFANIANVTLPAALRGVVGGVTGLHNFHARPHMHMIARPQFTSSTSGGHFLTPGDVNTIYDMKPLFSSVTGAGIGTGANCHSVNNATCGDIAVVGEVDLTANNADVAAFRTAAGLTSANLITVHAGGADPGPATCGGCSAPNSFDLQESSLDVEWSGAMAPGASILFVNAAWPCVLPGASCSTGMDAMTWAIDNNLAPIITDSYGNCETAWGSTDLNAMNQLFKQAAAQGQTVIAAAGDSGAADCDTGIPTTTTNGFALVTEGLNVDFPASSPYVLGMGGTMFNGDAEATGSGTIWSANQYWAGASGSDAASSALSYIPEMVWNEDAVTNSLSAGGGGVSAFFTKPAWQVETGASGMATTVPADASRDVPDVALAAAAVHDPLLFCYSFTVVPASNPYYNPGCVSGFRQSSNGNLAAAAGGTSFDSQMFGGMLALIEQKIGSRIGLAMPTLYALGNNATYYNNTGASVFHDITSGNNNDPCTAGTSNCPNGGNMGYNAATGYDLATGWGSVDLNNLALAWGWGMSNPIGSGLSTGTSISTTALTTFPSCNGCSVGLSPGNSATLTATVTGAKGTPTGTVQLLDNNAALGAPVALNSSGVATYTFNATCSTLGQQMMTAVYSGDSTYASSKGPALPTGQFGSSGGAATSSNGSINTAPLIFDVTSSLCSDFSLAPGGSGFFLSFGDASVTVPIRGTIPPLILTLAPLNGFAGTVTLSATMLSSTGYFPTVAFTPASLTFTSNSSASQTATVTLSGITADLRLPVWPGRLCPSYPWYAPGSGVAVASLLLLVFPRRRRLGGLLAIALFVALAMGVMGCGGGGSYGSSSSPGSGTVAPNPYVGTYVVNIQATYSGSGQTITHSTSATYTIQ